MEGKGEKKPPCKYKAIKSQPFWSDPWQPGAFMGKYINLIRNIPTEPGAFMR